VRPLVRKLIQGEGRRREPSPDKEKIRRQRSDRVIQDEHESKKTDAGRPLDGHIVGRGKGLEALQ